MSEIKVNKISPRVACGTTTLGDSGDTFTIPTGVTITNSGTAAGFGSTGEVSWNTTVKTGDFTATSGSGFFINTAGGAVTVTLPSSPSAGNVVAVSDYNGSAGTNTITLARNGSNINGLASNLVISKANSAVQLVYVDATTGWQNVTTANPSDVSNPFVAATGGTITCCGNFKIHTFTGPGTFCVSSAGSPSGSTTVEYLVVAGGGSGSAKGPGDGGGGGGAGGFRFASPTLAPLTFPGKPLNGPSAITVTATSFPITVGGGGSGASSPGGPCAPAGNGANGSNSIFSSITSTGGGKGGYNPSRSSGTGSPGGSGGGGNAGNPSPVAGGSGNTPPVSPSQGNNGGGSIFPSSPNSQGGAGGGATAVGANGSPGVAAGGAGAGLPTGFGANGESCGSFRYYAGGGAGGRKEPANGSGGVGGGGDTNAAGTTNTGGGGGGGGANGSSAAGTNGGSGIVVIRYKYQ
jgi:hypothetical protein